MPRGLSTDRIVSAAIELADAEGLAAVSMARVAKRVGFTTMALYRHVANKDELVRRMFDEALGPAPEYEIEDWRSGLRRWAYELRAVLRRHPWVIDVPITGEIATAGQLSWLERGLQALDGTGLAPGEDADLILLLTGYVYWGVRLELSLAAARAGPLVPPELDLSELPLVRRVVEAEDEHDATPEELFESGLERVLDGIGVLVARRAGRGDAVV